MARPSLDLRSALRTAVPKPVRRAAWSVDAGLTRVEQAVFERRMGVSTTGHVYLDDVGLDEPGRAFYEECEWLPVRRALKALEPGPDDVFVDLGSGKGQGLLIAGELPFGRVIGVDLVEELSTAAEANLRRARARGRLRCASAEAVAADALQWPFPEATSVVFMYCPFTGDLFRDVVGRIFDSYDANPRPVYLVYDYPWEHDWLIETGRVVMHDVAPAQWPTKPWWWRTSWVIVTYRVVAEGQGGPGVPSLPRRLYRPHAALERWSAPNGNRFSLERPGHETIYSRP